MRISDWSSDVCSSDLEVYNCQDLMQVAAASLLAWALSLLNSADGGLPILEIRAQVVDELTSQSELGFAGSWREFRSRNVRETYDFRETWNQITNWRGAPDEKAMAAVQDRKSTRLNSSHK